MSETHAQDELIDDWHPSDEEGLCDCGKCLWDQCDCGVFFLEWICGMDPRTGFCSMAGSEDCDWECPRRG